MKPFMSNQDGIVEGAIYAIVTIATVLVLMIALGPVMNYIQVDLYGTLEQEDTIFVNSDSGWAHFIDMVATGNNVWEMSFIFFIFIAIVYMMVRAWKKQTYTQQRYR